MFFEKRNDIVKQAPTDSYRLVQANCYMQPKKLTLNS